MEAASGSAIPTKLCVLDAVTPAKRHRAQQFTGGKNIGVPATLARTAFEEADRITPRKPASRQRRGPLLGPGQAPRIWSETERVRGPSNSARMILCHVPRTS